MGSSGFSCCFNHAVVETDNATPFYTSRLTYSLGLSTHASYVAWIRGSVGMEGRPSMVETRSYLHGHFRDGTD